MSSEKVTVIWERCDLLDRPDFVEVQLFRDGELASKATLSNQNRWSHIWENLSSYYEWTIQEQAAPDGFTVSVKKTSQGHDIIYRGSATVGGSGLDTLDGSAPTPKPLPDHLNPSDPLASESPSETTPVDEFSEPAPTPKPIHFLQTATPTPENESPVPGLVYTPGGSGQDTEPSTEPMESSPVDIPIQEENSSTPAIVFVLVGAACLVGGFVIWKKSK